MSEAKFYHEVDISYKKTKGSLRVALLPPKRKEVTASTGTVVTQVNEGAILLSGTPIIEGSDGKRDWDKTVKFALSPNDIADLLAWREGEYKRIHKHPTTEHISTLTITPKDQAIFFNLNGKAKSGDDVKFSMPLTLGELFLLKKLAEIALPKIIDWE